MKRTALKLFGVSLIGIFITSKPASAQPTFIDDHQIRITDSSDLAHRRQLLIEFIWGTNGFPSSKMPASVDLNLSQADVITANLPPLSGLNNLLRVDRLNISMDRGQQGRAYHFIPQRPNNRLVIVHHGHVTTFNDDPSLLDSGYGMQRTINSLLTDGYSVLAVYMPPYDFGVLHDPLFTEPRYAPASGSPMQYFLEPVAASLNYLKTHSANDGFPVYQDFNMVGLSGGGWTTTMYAAIDPTIKFSFPVAGSTPLFNRYGTSSWGDAEQTLTNVYQDIAGYPDLYVMGSYEPGRKQVWILNRRDDCCFGDDQFSDPQGQGRGWEQTMRDYENSVRLKLYNLGSAGSFRLEIDEDAAAHAHMITWNTVVNQILSELNGGGRDIAASSSSHAYVRGPNAHLWHRSPDGWEDTGFPMVGVAAALEGVVNQLDVFYRDGGNNLMHAFSNGAGWKSNSAGGVIISDPAVVSTVAGSYDIVAFGGDYNLYHWHGTRTGIGNYELVTDLVMGLGTPSLVTRGPEQLDVFFHGFDHGLYHIAWTNQFSSMWEPVRVVLGDLADCQIQMTDFPSAVAAPDGSLRVYVRGQSGRLWEAAKFNGGPWQGTAISDLVGGECIVGSPSASVQGNTVKVGARQSQGNLSTFTFGGSWSFASKGGVITGSPTSTPNGVWVRGQGASLYFSDGTNWFSIPTQTLEAPTLEICLTSTNAVGVSWSSALAGWALQLSGDISGTINWSNVTSGIFDDGTNKTLIISPPTGNRFYRLIKP